METQSFFASAALTNLLLIIALIVMVLIYLKQVSGERPSPYYAAKSSADDFLRLYSTYLKGMTGVEVDRWLDAELRLLLDIAAAHDVEIPEEFRRFIKERDAALSKQDRNGILEWFNGSKYKHYLMEVLKKINSALVESFVGSAISGKT